MSNGLPEEPLYTTNSDAKEPIVSNKLVPEKLTEEEKRKTKTLEFCFKAAPWIAVLALIFVVGDVICKSNGLTDTLVEDGFSLITYIVTAALGYIFANNSNSHG